MQKHSDEETVGNHRQPMQWLELLETFVNYAMQKNHLFQLEKLIFIHDIKTKHKITKHYKRRNNLKDKKKQKKNNY